jgi:hypothetical protein
LSLVAILLLAQAQALELKLELSGKVNLVRSGQVLHSYERQGGSAIPIEAQPGDRFCLEGGQARILYGPRAFTLSASSGCFQLAQPAGNWERLVETCRDIKACKARSKQYCQKMAGSKGTGDATPLYLPTDFSLPSLTLPSLGAQVLRLLDAEGQEVLRQQPTDSLFRIPRDRLRFARRLELKKGEITVLSTEVVWVVLETDAIPQNPKAQGLRLFLSGELGFAPAAYSYLLAAGEQELALELREHIRIGFPTAK